MENESVSTSLVVQEPSEVTPVTQEVEGITSQKILSDFTYARSKWKKLHTAAEEDFEFALGKQWSDTDIATLESQGVKALTINKIQPLIYLVSGIERQNRTDLICYPEGKEDSIEAELSTKLVQHLAKVSDFDYKASEQFEDGAICGMGFLEPFIDRTNDILNGELKWSKNDPFGQCYPDPLFKEYDLSDARFFIKFTSDLSKDQLIELFPDKKAIIDTISDGRIGIDTSTSQTEQKKDNYGSTGKFSEFEIEEPMYDLVEYYYKKYVTSYVVIDKALGNYQETTDKSQADAYAQKWGEDGSEIMVKPRSIPEIWCASLVGSTKIDDSKCWSYPKWKSYPFIPFFAHRVTTPIKDRDLMLQGIVRSLKDPQVEYNKRRTQILKIINSTANSGWKTPKGSWTDKDAVAKFGSSPGVILEYDPEKGEPQRIEPPTTPIAHERQAEENSNDIREISGINADLLAANESNASGRAMNIRMKQGTMMLQRMMDNNKKSKMLAGKFMLAMLGDLFTVESALKVIGDDIINELFSEPVMQPKLNPMTGQMENMPIDNGSGEMVMQVNNDSVNKVLNFILNDVNAKKYNIAIGEGANSVTMREANYLELVDLAKQGVAIPPTTIIEESFLPEESKKRIKEAMMQYQMQQANAPK
jgi:hypothetical protein